MLISLILNFIFTNRNSNSRKSPDIIPLTDTQRLDMMFLNLFIRSICYQLSNFFWNFIPSPRFNSPAVCLSFLSYLLSMDVSALLLGKLIITAQNTCSMNSKVYTTHFISVVMENCSEMTIYMITDYRNTTKNSTEPTC